MLCELERTDEMVRTARNIQGNVLAFQVRTPHRQRCQFGLSFEQEHSAAEKQCPRCQITPKQSPEVAPLTLAYLSDIQRSANGMSVLEREAGHTIDGVRRHEACCVRVHQELASFAFRPASQGQQ